MASADGNNAGKRKRLQQLYEHGTRAAAQGQFDYATNLYVQCVTGDPGNPVYAKALLENLFKQYNNNKKGGKFVAIKGAGVKASLKKASMSKDWNQAILSGMEMLKLNPWDTFALTTMATACESLNHDECQLVYLRGALDGNPKDIDVNRRCGRALARARRYDDAVSCWRRVDQLKPGDEEAARAIADLAVEKTISRGGYEEAESTKDVRAKPMDSADVMRLTREQQLERAIGKNPQDINNYVELADMHTNNDRFADAEKVLARALEIAGGDLAIRERLEDTQVRRLRAEAETAKADVLAKGGAEAKEALKRKSVELNRVEMEIFRNRSERSPNNMRLKYELGVRLKRAGKINEAIQYLQAARGDSKLKGEAHLELGECFQLIKQHKLAMSNYQTALESLFERDLERRKLVLYRAGTLSFEMQDVDGSEKYLNELASLDFAFKDVAKWLEKISAHRNNGGL